MTTWHEATFGRRPHAVDPAVERPRLKLGFIALNDCAPLVMARAAGFFAAEGLDVTLSRESSWASIRDKVALGLLDGAQMLAGMPIASTLGVGAAPHAMVTAVSLGLNGNAITVSKALYERMVELDPQAAAARPCSAQALRKVIQADREAGLAPLTFGMVHPTSAHNYQLRYWLAAAGIDPDRDVRLVVVPPARMVANLEAGRLAGYCVGEPWNQMAVRAGLGRALITGYEIWNNAPEKVLGVTREWAEAYPRTHRALVRAIVRTAAWLDSQENRELAADTVAAPDYVNAPAEVIRRTLSGRFCYQPGAAPRPAPYFNVFHRHAATFAWRSHAMWFIAQMLRWGQIGEAIDIAATADHVYRPDIYRAAVEPLGVACPGADHKTEGVHDGPWSLAAVDGRSIAMAADRFLDGAIFDPSNVMAYFTPDRARLGPTLYRRLETVNATLDAPVVGAGRGVLAC
ncbi:CmpA/NrtA family ABC transporter substrate-binding protein [Salinisphaera sp. C84B14]|uniref:CmpA/NrtA family ABC transporter substrate-binding protein n=1 Tax=Salinisphaera sp. C84B14 TaxID=1304155 RepID=UPI0033422B1D